MARVTFARDYSDGVRNFRAGETYTIDSATARSLINRGTARAVAAAKPAEAGSSSAPPEATADPDESVGADKPADKARK